MSKSKNRLRNPIFTEKWKDKKFRNRIYTETENCIKYIKSGTKNITTNRNKMKSLLDAEYRDFYLIAQEKFNEYYYVFNNNKYLSIRELVEKNYSFFKENIKNEYSNLYFNDKEKLIRHLENAPNKLAFLDVERIKL